MSSDFMGGSAMYFYGFSVGMLGIVALYDIRDYGAYA
jgi:hypothetical protein